MMYTPEETKANRAAWVAELRSGKYRQTKRMFEGQRRWNVLSWSGM